MHLLQIESPGQAVWRPAAMPELREGEVLLRVEGVTTCPHWDMHVLDGEPMFPGMEMPYPYTPGQPGHEAVGTVERLGPGADAFPAGARVAAWRDPGGRRQGAYARYMPIHQDDLLAVGDDVPAEAIASLELAMCVQVSFDQLMRVDAVAGKRVGVSGMGPAGLIAVQMARAYGAAEVVAFDVLEDRLALARSLGADAAMHPGAFASRRRDAGALDAALDTTGLKRSIEFLVDCTRETVAIFGVLREVVGFGPANWWGGFSLMGYGQHNRAAGERALDLIASGRLDLKPLVTHTLPFTRYSEGIALLRSKEAIKILFDPWA
ncbi:MAG: zinc-binding dehydrogenase [Rhodothermales bacterium]